LFADGTREGMMSSFGVTEFENIDQAQAGQTMARPKPHSRVEVATKLAQANDLARQGRPQSEIARTLGGSVVTLHRWRKRTGAIGRAAGTIELRDSSSRIHGCGGW